MKIIKRDSRDEDAVYTPVRSVFDDFFRFPSMFDDPFYAPSTYKGVSADIWEEKDAVYVKMAVPGIKEDDLKISVENDMVTISGGVKKEEESDKKDKRYFFRSMESSFEQTFRLPCSVDVNASEAKLNDGVVTVKLQKSEKEKAKEVKIIK